MNLVELKPGIYIILYLIFKTLMLPEWDQKYSINNEKIDEQHKKLFELTFKVEEISNRPIYQVELKKIVADFFHYIKIHFQDEENYMAEINYPYLTNINSCINKSHNL